MSDYYGQHTQSNRQRRRKRYDDDDYNLGGPDPFNKPQPGYDPFRTRPQQGENVQYVPVPVYVPMQGGKPPHTKFPPVNMSMPMGYQPSFGQSGSQSRRTRRSRPNSGMLQRLK